VPSLHACRSTLEDPLKVKAAEAEAESKVLQGQGTANQRKAIVEGLKESVDGFQKHITGGTELEFVIMVIAVSCVKLLSAHNSTQHTSRKHKV
jgi:hypothetical protein